MEKYGYRLSFCPWNIHIAARDYEQLDWLILSHLMGQA